MSWILHDPSRRAVIGAFATREEAESWRDRNGLGQEFAAAPQHGRAATMVEPRSRACEARGLRLRHASPRRRFRR